MTRLNISEKVRSNLFPWNGQFSPQLVHALLETYGRERCTVLDPFMGSGTVLIEAGRLGMKAIGCEINPAACQMAHTYELVNVRPEDRRRSVEVVDVLIDQIAHAPLFSAENPGDRELKSGLLCLCRREADGPVRRLLQTLIVLLDFYRAGLTAERILDRWRGLRSTIIGLPYSQQPLWISNCDARKLPHADRDVDLVVTSPPYINVFNYHQQYRRSVEVLGWNLLHVARSEIGSNRKNRQNRFLTVIQYCLDIAQALTELRRVIKPDGRIIFVVGRESNVLGTPFYNGQIVANLGVRCVGLHPEARQERSFVNRFGATIREDIIHFRLPTGQSGSLVRPVVVAKESLEAALGRAQGASIPYLKDAIRRAGQIKPSPIYKPLAREGRHADEPSFADAAF